MREGDKEQRRDIALAFEKRRHQGFTRILDERVRNRQYSADFAKDQRQAEDQFHQQNLDAIKRRYGEGKRIDEFYAGHIRRAEETE